MSARSKSIRRTLHLLKCPYAWLAFNRFISSGYAVGVAASPFRILLAFGEAEVWQGELIHGKALILYYLCFFCAFTR